MFVILTYDVNARRVNKVMKTCRKYLTHEQNSVFEGTITENKLERLKRELKKLIDPEADRITIYELQSLKYTSKENIGLCTRDTNICCRPLLWERAGYQIPYNDQTSGVIS